MIESKYHIEHAIYLAQVNLELIFDPKARVAALNSRSEKGGIISHNECPMKHAEHEMNKFLEYTYFQQHAAGVVFTIYNKIREIDFVNDNTLNTHKKIEEIPNSEGLFVGEVAYLARNELAHFEEVSLNSSVKAIKDKIRKLNSDICLQRPHVDFVGLLKIVGWESREEFCKSINILLKEKSQNMCSYEGHFQWK